MATHYITSTADSGEGSLRQLLKDAPMGDTIQPSPVLFPTGTVCRVTLESKLTTRNSTLGMNITGGQTRLEINGNGQYSFGGNCVLTLQNVDFVALSGGTSSAVAFSKKTYIYRCRIIGCRVGNYVLGSTLESLEMYDCAIYGCALTGSSPYILGRFYSMSLISRTTIGGNVGQNGINGDYVTNGYITVVDCAGSSYTSEWATPPPSSYAYSTWTKNSWKDMDPRPTSTSSFRTGSSTSAPSINDLDGLARKTNGALGAYEYDPLPRITSPNSLNATNITSNSALLGWNAVQNAVNYGVDYKLAGDSLWTRTNTD